MTIIEKIIARHCGREKVSPGDIADVEVDLRLARDFGGAGVVKNLMRHHLSVADVSKTWFTFDCNPTGSDQEYAANQHFCRLFARENNIGIYDINAGIGTHLAIDEGLAVPGCTLVSTDSHANILGAIGCFGQGMGDRDIAAAWSRGSVWFRVPETVRIHLSGNRPAGITAKDIALNMLRHFGPDTLLGCSVEVTGIETDKLTLDERITISSMATEMGAIILFIAPSEEINRFCLQKSGREFIPVFSDEDTLFTREYTLYMSRFSPLVSLPGKPHQTLSVSEAEGKKIDSVFIGSCTNGRMEDMRAAAAILKGRKVAPGVVLKIVPSTDRIWKDCMQEGLWEIFKESGALIGNAGCAGCASGQVGQNGPGEVTVSTGNRNFTGKQGKGDVYLASPAVAAASAVAGHICAPGNIPSYQSLFFPSKPVTRREPDQPVSTDVKPDLIEGCAWLINRDNIDTDMIYHNSHLAVTEKSEMGRYTFGNLKDWEDFANRAKPGDILFAGRNFGSGSSRQHAVDCFIALKIQAIVAPSFGSIYERNAINAGFPVLECDWQSSLGLKQGDRIMIDLAGQVIRNLENGKEIRTSFSEIQRRIYQAGDLLLLRENEQIKP
jgi:homoaconitase/3-isopropylmalate dehydratase large subunit/3-isopropylmalate dehydratase small subunit